MKLSEAIGARTLLEKIAGKEMNGASALAYAEFVREVLTEIQKFENDRATLFEKYGEKVDDTNIKIKPENEKKFQAAVKKALNKKLKVEPFDISASGVSIAPVDLINALPLFK